MINYSLNNNFFNKDEISEILSFCKKNGESFSYNPNETWDCKRIYDEEFKQKILSKFIENIKTNIFKLWFDFEKFNLKNINVSLTSYYDNRYLNLHKDKTSELTTVIVMSDGYEGGQFALSDSTNPSYNFEKLDDISLFDLKMGDSISFNGSETYHGVLPVTEGIRYALNIWMTETDYDYLKLKKNKTLL